MTIYQLIRAAWHVGISVSHKADTSVGGGDGGGDAGNKVALLRFTVASFSGKLIFNGSAVGTFTIALKSLFLKH